LKAREEKKESWQRSICFMTRPVPSPSKSKDGKSDHLFVCSFY
jgi:hypothetical protein